MAVQMKAWMYCNRSSNRTRGMYGLLYSAAISVRTLPSNIANWLISRVTGVHLHDYGCTLKAYRRTVLGGFRLYGEMHRFIPVFAHSVGARITEITVSHHPRKFGKANYGLERTAKVILDLFTVKFLLDYSHKPI